MFCDELPSIIEYFPGSVIHFIFCIEIHKCPFWYKQGYLFGLTRLYHNFGKCLKLFHRFIYSRILITYICLHHFFPRPGSCIFYFGGNRKCVIAQWFCACPGNGKSGIR